MPGSRSKHNCWAKKHPGCNKSKINCTEHYWNCSGAGTRTHALQKVPSNGSGCESSCRDTSDNEIYTCGRKHGDPLIPNSSSLSAYEKRILIVGSGCFGISTAYHLLKRGYKDVTVVDRAETLAAVDAASTDLNKIVGFAHEDVYYARLGQRAMEEWTTNEIWRPAYDQSGLVIVDYNDGFFDAAQASGADLVTLTDAASLHAVYPPALQNGGLGTMIAPTATHSESAGSAKAAKAIELTIDAVRELEGKVLTGRAACGTLRDKSGRLTGVKFKDGSVVEADCAVLAAGAWTASAFPELGLEKFPELGLEKFPELGLDNLIFASGQSIATVKLPHDLAKLYRKCPISWAYNAGFHIFPPDDDDIVKISMNYAGYTYTPPSAAGISTPRTFLTDGTAGLQIPTKMATAIRNALQQMYPELAHLPFESTRLCWYTYSNDEDWVIDEVESCKNLFVATAGSGHGFKFLPVIGELIADRLEGNLAPEIARKFSMSRDRGAFKGGYGVLHEPIELDLNDLCTDFNH